MFFLNKPAIVLSDYQEMEDILLRRTREFDRSSFIVEMYVYAFHWSLMKLIHLDFTTFALLVQDVHSFAKGHDGAFHRLVHCRRLEPPHRMNLL